MRESRAGTSFSAISFSDKKAEIDMLAAEYISTVKALSPGQRVEQLRKIQDAYSRCREYSDDKVQLAMQTYEMVSGQGLPTHTRPPCHPRRCPRVEARHLWGRCTRGPGAVTAVLSSVPFLLWLAVAAVCFIYPFLYISACLIDLR